MSSFLLVQGNSVPNLEGIAEGYCIRDCNTFFHIIINVSAENIERVFCSLCACVREPGFLLLEHGTNRKMEEELRTKDTDPFHKDVYYLDGLTTESLLQLMAPYMGLLVNDGEINFGFGSHQGTDEVFVGPYKIFNVYSNEPQKYEEILLDHGYQQSEPLKTVWETFTEETPGGRMCVTRDGLDIYQMVEQLQEKGLYLAERRADK